MAVLGDRRNDMKLPTRHRRSAGRAVLLAAAVGLVAGALVIGSSTRNSSSASTSRASEFDAPSGLAFGGGHLWVTNLAGNSVTEIDPSAGTWIRTLRASSYGFKAPIAIASSGPDLFVANETGSLTEIRASDAAPIRTISGPRFGFIDPVAIAVAGNTVLVVNAGRPSATPTVAGSITEIDASTGRLLRTVSGATFAFDDPVALTVSGQRVFVADEGDNSVTEINTTKGTLVHVIVDQGLNAPDGIAVGDGHVWVADAKSNAATEIDAETGVVITTVNDSDGKYGFGSPSVAIESAGNVFIASPYGTSPMVTRLSAATSAPSWYMCNTNGPYYFSLLSAFAVSGNHLWVASRSGANSKTPGAKSGSLTELNAVTGALIATLPLS
jgi:DNA-binding beta-propeller fold protein YncE